ncbi:hypothetical protein ACFU44_00285 [Nocardia rhizosphaerihabitans]|uniref:phage upper tail fiber protein n=1 Tax=Nocardia rhizosphaerihabitans TaxID=1691570 RepID=UPI00366DEF30
MTITLEGSGPDVPELGPVTESTFDVLSPIEPDLGGGILVPTGGPQGSKGDKGDTGDTGDPGRGYVSVDISGNNLEFTPTTGSVETVAVPALAQASADAASASASATAADNARVLAEQAAEDAQNGIIPDGAVTVPKLAADVEQAMLDAAENRIGFYRGVADGLAPLDGNGVVSPAFLPSYVDDVLEAANFASLPGTGEPDKIYITIDTGKIYRWGGSAYAEISASPGSTDAVPEGVANLYYTDARVSSRVNTMYGTGSNTVCQGNDSRLSDARTPTSHGHPQSDVSGLTTALAGKVGSSDSNVLDIVKITQAAYNALGAGRPATRLYVIVG